METKKKHTERDILDQALQAVKQETGLRMRVKKTNAILNNYQVDALIQIDDTKQVVAVEIKKWAQQANLGALINQVKQLPKKGMLVADYVNPKMAEKLRHEGVQFIDTAGNAFINMPPVYMYVTGHRCETPQFMPTEGGAKRAFEPTGLKVIFAFLCYPELVNAPYREIAEKAGVAVGTVGWVLNGLKAADFIRDKGDNQRRLVHAKKLLMRWVEVYPEKLRPKQFIGEFIADEPNWWKNINIKKYHGYWGGEIAAAKYTRYLKPQIATLYIHDDALARLLADGRLRKATTWPGDAPGVVKIYRPFWNEDIIEPDIEIKKGYVHPILAYADLVATGDTRNSEVARRIYDERIAQYFREG
ncbi:MAG: type IV toxin-antitoxin system AbiEi family antitoxin [Gammaproteobacteria bacterium]|nr:type IV toxin-antitoxin system AbiEi family antitoxin [Gammaproteobacteria bacterium]